MRKEKVYLFNRILKGKLQSALFYFFRLFPIQQKKIVFCCIEGTTGYSCNPKYIAEELLRRKCSDTLVWLVNDTGKKFPKEIKVVKNTLWNRAYELTTAHIWVDNSRKQLEVRKRQGQIYIQTWHAKLGFKPTCLDRGASFTKIAYLVSRHDSDLVDYWLSNSDWYDKSLKTGSLYEGKTLRFGSPRCDILVNQREAQKEKVRKLYHLPQDTKLLMYAPTFRGGSQETDRRIRADEGMLNYDTLVINLKNRFGGNWHILLRLHPQLAARQIENKVQNEKITDVSKADDMYEILAGCDAFMTDYSSAAFDAALMMIPVFLYCEDYREYEKERGSLLWNLREMPFGMAEDQKELGRVIEAFDEEKYRAGLEELFRSCGVREDGRSSERMAEFLEDLMGQAEEKWKTGISQR